jgi:hypothetical protein
MEAGTASAIHRLPRKCYVNDPTQALISNIELNGFFSKLSNAPNAFRPRLKIEKTDASQYASGTPNVRPLFP